LQAVVNHTRTQSSFARRALRVALCYVLALQAIAAAFGTALSVGQASNAAAGFTICHGSADAPSNGTTGTLDVTCVLCAVAASAVLLSDPPSVAARSSTSIRRAPRAEVAVIVRPPLRSGLARAPPQFA